MYSEASWMDSEDEEYDEPPDELFYSHSHCLLCSIEPDGSYFVLNGCWRGIRKDKDFEILWQNKGHPENRHLTITDWKQYTREEFDKAYPDFGY